MIQEEDFVKYEEALALKKLGFDNKCLAIYYEMEPKELVFAHVTKNGKMLYQHNSLWDSPQAGVIAVPTYHQVFNWFKKEHKFKFYIREDIWNHWCSVKILQGSNYINIGDYESYEKAELACLKELIKRNEK